MRCWKWWSSAMPWWPSWRSSGFGRRKRTRTWRPWCSPKALTSTGPKGDDPQLPLSSLSSIAWRTPAAVNVKRHPATHTNMTTASDSVAVDNVYISSARKAVHVNHFAVLFSLCLWVERRELSQLYLPRLEENPLKRGGTGWPEWETVV